MRASWRLIELEAGDAFAVGQARRCGEFAQLPAVDERFDDVLLDREVPVRDGRHGLAQPGHVIDRLGDAQIRDVVGGGGGLGATQEVIAHVLFDGPVAAVAADDWIRHVEIFDHGFELATVPLGYLATEDGGELRRLANRAVRIEQAVTERVQGDAAVEDQAGPSPSARTGSRCRGAPLC